MIKKVSIGAVLMSASLSATANSYSLQYITHGTFDKPVIFVEGYDPDNENYLTSHNGNDPYRQLRDFAASRLSGTGKDLVFVNFSNGGARIEDNAELLKQVIQQVNNAKVGNHPNAVIGYSMGGLVARWALKDMEDRRIDHDTSLYISYDAPHRGANVPYDIKSDLDKLQDKVKKYLFKNVDRDVIYSPAGKEMILWGSDSSRFYRALEAKGYPQNLRRVAFANGSTTNRAIGIPYNLVALDYRFEILQTKNYYRKTMSNGLTVCGYPCNPIGTSHLDNAPGSTTNTFAALLNGMRRDEVASGFDLDVYQDNTNQATHNFIPTLSAFDLRNHDYNDAITSSDLDYESPFDETYTTPYNYSHDSLIFTSQLASELNLYHTYGVAVPSRSHKKAQLADIGYVRNEWLVRGNYMLDWSAVPGATHYEVYLASGYAKTFPSSPIRTITGTHTSVNVSNRARVAVRACNSYSCSYPKTMTLIERDSSINPN